MVGGLSNESVCIGKSVHAFLRELWAKTSVEAGCVKLPGKTSKFIQLNPYRKPTQVDE